MIRYTIKLATIHECVQPKLNNKIYYPIAQYCIYMKFIVDQSLVENVKNFYRNVSEYDDTDNTYIFQHKDGNVTVKSGQRIVPTEDTEPELRVLLQDRRNDYSYETYRAYSATQHTRTNEMGREHTHIEIFHERATDNTQPPYVITTPMPAWTEVVYQDGERECFGEKKTQTPPYPLNNIGSETLVVESKQNTFENIINIQSHMFDALDSDYTLYNKSGETVTTLGESQIQNVYGNTYVVCMKETDGDKTKTQTYHNIIGIDSRDDSVTFTHHPQANTITSTIPKRRIDSLLIKTPTGEIKRRDSLTKFSMSNSNTSNDQQNTTNSPPPLHEDDAKILQQAVEQDMLTDTEKQNIVDGYPEAKNIVMES